MKTTLTALLTLTLIACDSAQLVSVLNQIDKPTASVAGARLNNLTLDGATIDFDVDVHNPYSFTLPLVGLGYNLQSGGKQIVAGEIDNPGSVPGRGKRRVTVPVSLRFADVLSALSGVRPGAIVPYEAALDFRAEAPAIGRISLPVRHAGEAPIPAVPQVTLASVEWEKLTMSEAAATLKLGIVNTNSFPIDLSQLSYALSLAGTPVADATVRKGVNFKAGGEQMIELPLRVNMASAGLAMFNAMRGDGASYQISGGIKAGTPFGALDMPYSSAGRTVFER